MIEVAEHGRHNLFHIPSLSRSPNGYICMPLDHQFVVEAYNASTTTRYQPRPASGRVTKHPHNRPSTVSKFESTLVRLIRTASHQTGQPASVLSPVRAPTMYAGTILKWRQCGPVAFGPGDQSSRISFCTSDMYGGCTEYDVDVTHTLRDIS